MSISCQFCVTLPSSCGTQTSAAHVEFRGVEFGMEGGLPIDPDQPCDWGNGIWVRNNAYCMCSVVTRLQIWNSAETTMFSAPHLKQQKRSRWGAEFDISFWTEYHTQCVCGSAGRSIRVQCLHWLYQRSLNILASGMFHSRMFDSALAMLKSGSFPEYTTGLSC